jgi:putative oxidoreductase
MEKHIISLMGSYLGVVCNNRANLFVRVLISLELIIAHGLKKIGMSTADSAIITNPLGLPKVINQNFVICTNPIFPIFIFFALHTRLATLPILTLTLMGYFVVHANDSPDYNISSKSL